MTNEEYIRKAVELADGWSIAKNGAITLPQPNDDYIDWPLLYLADSTSLGVLLDALAAQLTRQVDATNFVIDIHEGCTTVWHDVDGKSYWDELLEAGGPDLHHEHPQGHC